MHIAIEARSLSAKSGGVKTYTHELIRSLLQASGEDIFSVIYDSKSAFGKFPLAGEYVAQLPHHWLLLWWMNRTLGRTIGRVSPDIVHFTKADVPWRKQMPTVVTVYDIIPLLLPQTQTLFRRLYWPQALQRAATQSDHIITISQSSKDHLLAHFEVDPARITVTPLAIDHQHWQPVRDERQLRSLRDRYHLSWPYLLFVGTRDVRKNLTSLIRAYSKLAAQWPHHLVIAGNPAPYQDQSAQLVRQLRLGDRTHFYENVPYHDLPALYSAADLFVWPSIVEGWGFPPQEAMACGTPVIVSNGDPLPEVVGEAGEVVPFSTDSLPERFDDQAFIDRLAERIEAVLVNSSWRQRMRQAGLAHVRNFSWEKVARQTMAVYQKVV